MATALDGMEESVNPIASVMATPRFEGCDIFRGELDGLGLIQPVHESIGIIIVLQP
jgi:hypothetical protein